MRASGRLNLAYLYLLPLLVFLIVFIVYPIVANFYYGFFSWKGLSDRPSFLGIQNYINIFKDPKFFISIKNSLILAFFATVVRMAISLFIAYQIYNRVWASQALKIIYFIPVVISYLIVGKMFLLAFQDRIGYINVFFRSLGINFLALPWLSNPTFAIYTLAAVDMWKWVGFCVIIYLASLSTISEDIIEASIIDGASDSRIFTNIIVPLLRSAHYTLIILGSVGCLKIFEHIYVLTNAGPGDATMVMAFYIYRKSFMQFETGYASALSNILLVIILLVTIVQIRFYNQGGKSEAKGL
jgi:raffinose/stachyose/melibiose transport system permease protein